MDWYGLSMHLLRESGTMYKRIEATQISFYDFNQDLGFQLSEMNEWVRLSKIIPWDKIEELYQERFPGKTGNVAKSARMVLGSLSIQKRKGLSDRALVKEITENPYLQFFIGLPRFQAEAPFRPQSLVNFRKRMDCEMINQINELVLASAPVTKKKRRLTLQEMRTSGRRFSMPPVPRQTYAIHRTTPFLMKLVQSWRR